MNGKRVLKDVKRTFDFFANLNLQILDRHLSNNFTDFQGFAVKIEARRKKILIY